MPLLGKLESKQHIIWDWNGTILNDVDHAVETMNSLLNQYDLDLINKKKCKTLEAVKYKN